MAKKTTCRPCFSCGSDEGWWIGENCDNCIKSSRVKKGNKYFDDYTKSRCRIFDEIMEQWAGYGNEPVSLRTFHATQRAKCPYIVTEYPKRKRKNSEESLKIPFEYL